MTGFSASSGLNFVMTAAGTEVSILHSNVIAPVSLTSNIQPTNMILPQQIELEDLRIVIIRFHGRQLQIHKVLISALERLGCLFRSGCRLRTSAGGKAVFSLFLNRRRHPIYRVAAEVPVTPGSGGDGGGGYDPWYGARACGWSLGCVCSSDALHVRMVRWCLGVRLFLGKL